MGAPFYTSSDGIFLYHQRLSAYKWLRHGFSLRRNQDGAEMSYSLNGFQPHETVLDNRQSLVRSVSGRELPLAILRQVHSDRVIRASRTSVADSPQGDGWVTGESDLLLAIQTADCLPVLLVDPEQRIVAAVHAGWRGTILRIAAKAVHRMQTDFGSHPGRCLAVVGPAIRRCCYEVGDEVVEAFAEEFERSASFFSETPGAKATRANSQCVDLAEACRSQLLDAGMTAENIFTDGPCTTCEKQRFFSHRAEAAKPGRMMSVIGIVGS
jgi:purine-nucleoside/S-methyl-5'-thioadenosine phosphorylase / adenosine deaminase